ncbi:heavy metal-responsive transcriptional regulator [Streptomyces lunaelactis]|uniref:heavy metal-responsive transcriptional regulator n=1 Tax=Streptomyces lunaelactis TaxID=1535768 RepID=UPI0015849A65|nr:heavy metal-responsive transcriptional regulator [Streptomyces lunaelactis]NUK07367.1 heavy metal-responsive transcriptional regulator [Streptomyces lunaelactis]NUL08724.1 heavy metal-responsive transcriptional regulator [Streptomyces lunaelactis]NUL21544.1 heavy metal-responsive transcriptional regulator [Streptomyces lunaelactis]
MLTVGRIAARTGLSPKAVRLYEANGLIDPPERTSAGYRTYTDEAIPVLGFIRQAQALGLSLKEIKEILDLQRRGEQPCGFVSDLLDQHLADIDRRIADLQALRTTLRNARAQADRAAGRGENAVVCRIIEGASTGADRAAS